MKRMAYLATLVVSSGIVFGMLTADSFSGAFTAAAQDGRKPPEIIQMATTSKLGAVAFNHMNHITKNRNIEGTGPIACIECHHTEQPAAEVAKHPPLKTAWPVDRTTTLTAEALNDPKTPGVVSCQNCHAQTGATPKLLPAIPTIKSENSTATITLTNQQAAHRVCAGCHDQVVKTRKDVMPPTSTKCTACHKK